MFDGGELAKTRKPPIPITVMRARPVAMKHSLKVNHAPKSGAVTSKLRTLNNDTPDTVVLPQSYASAVDSMRQRIPKYTNSDKSENKVVRRNLQPV